ncbi:MAG: Mur ligase [Opitutales bacterium]|nr:Mur ligase [Opitutales bacterium]
MKIYFMGICGTAMGNIAVMLKNIGHEISGADTGVYEPMKSVLENAGIEICEGWDVERLKKISPDLVVVGNVISRMNVEIEWLLQTRAFEFTSLADLIGSKIIGSRPALVVSGTHGKTTTTTIATYLLSRQNSGTGWMIGGVPKDLPGGSNFGSAGAPFVIEGDEYDTAFFDKRSKFIHYRPRVLLINNIEFDHADIFRDLYDVKRTFTHVRRVVAGGGVIVENGDDQNIATLEPTPWVRRVKVGFGENCDLKISDFCEARFGSSFNLTFGGRSEKIEWGLQGEYNARNAAMAIMGVASILNLENPLDLDLSALASFGGVKRRQDVILDTPNVVAIEDFGHHPTAIAGTIKSLRERFAGFKIYAAFEPRSNTAKMNIFEDEFAKSLSLADKVCIAHIHNIEKLNPQTRMDTFRLAQKGGEKFCAFNSNEELLNALVSDVVGAESRGEKALCVFFSNGSFDGVHKKFAQIFAGK